MNRNTGIRGLFKPFRLAKEIAEDEAARAAVISKIGYSAPYNPVDVSTYRISDTLNKLQAAPKPKPMPILKYIDTMNRLYGNRTHKN